MFDLISKQCVQFGNTMREIFITSQGNSGVLRVMNNQISMMTKYISVHRENRNQHERLKSMKQSQCHNFKTQ